jgi:hypothetical protein
MPLPDLAGAAKSLWGHSDPTLNADGLQRAVPSAAPVQKPRSRRQQDATPLARASGQRL